METKKEKQGKKESLLAIVRVRGKINLKEDIKRTFDQLNLHNKNWCVIIKATPSNLGMVKKVKDYVTWGNIPEEQLITLIEKRGELFKERYEDKNSKIQYKKYLVHKKKKYKRYFRLNPPKKGYGRKGIKITFNSGGALGNRENKISDLLERMM